MKRTIDGKIYNTDTATKIATWSNGHNYNDFNYCDESLFVTSKGAYFVAGEGGAMSKYSQSHGNSRGSGEGIEVLTKSQALAWCEHHQEQDAIDKFFANEVKEA